MKFYPGALAVAVRKTMADLRDVQEIKDFYLAGGTALALILGHRESVDLNFFSATNTLGFEERKELLGQISRLRGFQLEEEKQGTLHALLGQTSVSFFHYAYPLLHNVNTHQGIQIASLEDIGLMKLAALAGRGSRKDFIDLFFLAKKQLPLKRLLELGSRKFKDQRDFSVQVMKAAVYFEDAEKEPIPKMNKKFSWEALKDYFKKAAREIA